MTLQHLKEEGDKDEKLSIEEIKKILLSDDSASFVFSTLMKVWNNALDLALHEIKNSPKTFGLLDKEGRGGAILVSDIEEIISKLKQ